MARSGKEARPGVAEGYGGATAADIARYGVRRREGASRPQTSVESGWSAEADVAQAAGRAGARPYEGYADAHADGRAQDEGYADAHADGRAQDALADGRVGARGSFFEESVGARTCAPDAPGGRIIADSALSRRRRAGARPYEGQMPTSSALSVSGTLALARTDALADEERRELRRKLAISMAILAVLSFLSLGIFGATSYFEVGAYVVFSPIEVAQVILDHAYNFVANVTHLFPSKSTNIYSVEGLYGAIPAKAQIIAITLLCAVLLSVAGMLYQNVFKNPIAGPGMLGVSSGVTLGMTLMVFLYGGEALGMLTERYAMCYGFGAAILLFVILAGRKLSGKGKPFDIVTMLLIGSILGQLVGFVVSYITLYVMDPSDYQIYLTLSQMLTVDTSIISWAMLIFASVVSLGPVLYLRFRLNALAFDEQEVRMLGINFTALRAVALVCGAIMLLAAQVHIGGVAMMSLIVPFLSRSWFGCEFRKQLVGNVCISTILLLLCRDAVDLIPFVGDGIGIGSAVSVMALPLFLLLMARHMRGWE